MVKTACSTILDRIALHFAHRRDTLEVLGRFGNRFEDWVKWEIATGLHVASSVDDGVGIGSIGAERDQCDVFVGGNEWPEKGWPLPHQADCWIEIKCRGTRDKGPAELAVDVAGDVDKQRRRKTERGIGHFLALAMIVSHPRGPDAEQWASSLISAPGLPRAPHVRRIYLDHRGTEPGVWRVLAAILAWEV